MIAAADTPVSIVTPGWVEIRLGVLKFDDVALPTQTPEVF
jgi:hypothetical protein